MNLTPPFSVSKIVQGFGANAVTAYAGMGLKGHPGTDFGMSWGTPIPCAVDATVSAILNPSCDPAFFAAVNTIYDDTDGFSYEVQYGHVSKIDAKIGDQVKVGDIVALVGNTGDVYAGGGLVPNSEKLTPPYPGSHLHFQVRKLVKTPVNAFESDKHYINDGQGLLTLNGFNYYAPEWTNGYNGCVDATQFFPTVDPYDTLVALGNQMMTTNPVQSKIVLAVAGVVKAFTK